MPGVFAAGDIAAVPDLSRPGEFCAPNAQHAVRQSKVLARNIVAFARGGQLKSYRHAYVGSVAGLGHHQGVAQVYQIRLTGFAGWLAHRVYHLFWVPTLSHKARVLADWTLALFFRRETAQLASRSTPPTTSAMPSARPEPRGSRSSAEVAQHSERPPRTCPARAFSGAHGEGLVKFRTRRFRGNAF